MEEDMKAYRRPGKMQTVSVILVCLLLMAVSAYIGLMLLSGQPMDPAIQRIFDEVQGYVG